MAYLGLLDVAGGRGLRESAPITFGDYTFHAGGDVNARFATQFTYAAFRYDILHESDKIRISESVGLTFIRLKASLTGEGNVTDANGVPISGEFEKGGSQGAPVPLVGLNLDRALTRRVVVRTYSRFFRLIVSSFNGELYEDGVRLNGYFVKNFG